MDDEIEIRMNRAEAKFEMLFELSPIGMAMVSHETGEFLEVNRSLLNSTGYTKAEFLNLSFWDITPREYEEQEMQQIKDLNEKGKFGPNEKEYIRKDGSRYPIEISGFMLIDVDGSKVVWGIIEDISKRRKMEDELKFRALHDPLTGLANRMLFSQRLSSSIEYCAREKKLLAIFMMDLDKFKSVNDTYGHKVGDALLVEVGNRINSHINRKTDTVARIGGDEFAVIITLLNDENDANIIADRICDALNKTFVFSKLKIEISVSIGISIFPEHGETEDELLSKADYAVYEMKNQGRNGYRIYNK